MSWSTEVKETTTFAHLVAKESRTGTTAHEPNRYAYDSTSTRVQHTPTALSGWIGIGQTSHSPTFVLERTVLAKAIFFGDYVTPLTYPSIGPGPSDR